jgi:hypothetical protein
MGAEAQASWARTMVTEHAARRMAQRGLRLEAVATALRYGRCVHARGAWLYVVGRREVARARSGGVDLSAFEGVHVVCAADGAILTVFRNRDLAVRDSARRWLSDGARRRPSEVA